MSADDAIIGPFVLRHLSTDVVMVQRFSFPERTSSKTVAKAKNFNKWFTLEKCQHSRRLKSSNEENFNTVDLLSTRRQRENRTTNRIYMYSTIEAKIRVRDYFLLFCIN